MWIEPKTDWVESDAFDANSFNRIAGNVNEIQQMAGKIFQIPKLNAISDNKTYEDYFYADEFNQIENNLHTINSSSFKKNIGDERTYYTNKPTPDHAEYNRIESACNVLHNELAIDISILPKLTVRLGNVKGVKL